MAVSARVLLRLAVFTLVALLVLARRPLSQGGGVSGAHPSSGQRCAGKPSSIFVGYAGEIPYVGKTKAAVQFVVGIAQSSSSSAGELYSNVATDLSSGNTFSQIVASHSPKVEVHEFRVSCVNESIITWGKDGKGKKDNKKQKPNKQASDLEKKRKEREKKKAEAEEETVKKIQTIDKNFKLTQTLGEGRSKRGEHVINNDVIKFHSELITDFFEENDEQFLDELTDLLLSPLSEKTKSDIGYNMVVHFGQDELYFNANAVVYAFFKTRLTEVVNNYLSKKGDEDEIAEARQQVINVIDELIKEEAYVDQYAAKKWLASKTNSSKNKVMYKYGLNNVTEMYRDSRGITYYDKIKKRWFIKQNIWSN